MVNVKISFGKAFYRQAKFLMIDEATSALDNQTESEVIQSLDIIGRRWRRWLSLIDCQP